MKKITIGILAHVDSGKTTLSEAILYQTGLLRTLGRVDHGNAFMDSHEIEQDRGITIQTIEEGVMTGDLYLLSTLPEKKKVNTEEFLLAVNERLQGLLK